MKKVFSLLLALVFILTAFAGCESGQKFSAPSIPSEVLNRSSSSSESEPEKETSSESSSSESPETEKTPLDLLREQGAAYGADCLIAYLGYAWFPWGDGFRGFLENTPYDEETYPFLYDVREEDIVFADGEEVYCIIPVKPEGGITVTDYIVDESNDWMGEPGEELYHSDSCELLIVVGNVSDAVPNLQIQLQTEEGELAFEPRLSLQDGMIPYIEQVLDFSVYEAAEETNTEAEELLIPEGLIGCWTTLMMDPDGTQYLLQMEFREDMTLKFRMDVDGETMEYVGTWKVYSDSPIELILEYGMYATEENLTGCYTFNVRGDSLRLTWREGDELSQMLSDGMVLESIESIEYVYLTD